MTHKLGIVLSWQFSLKTFITAADSEEGVKYASIVSIQGNMAVFAPTSTALGIILLYIRNRASI